MVLAPGMVLWFQTEERYQLTAADLKILETSRESKISDPVVTGDAYDRPKVSVHNLVVIPKVWDPYFMEPKSPWRAIHMFKMMLGTKSDNLKDYFDFIGEWISIAFTHEVAKDESAVRDKWKNPHENRRVLEWMLMHTCFINSMPLVSWPHAGNNLDPKNCFNKTLDTVEALEKISEAKKYIES